MLLTLSINTKRITFVSVEQPSGAMTLVADQPAPN